MSVIGRLDEQVDEVLIAPLSRRPRPEEPPAPELHEPRDATPPDPARGPSTAEDKDESRPQAPELPVWLL